MLWQLEQAPLLFGILLPHIKIGRDVPPKVADRPELELGLGLYWNAYLELSTDRNHYNQIGWTKVVQWADRYKLDETQTEYLVEICRAMDKVFCEWKAKQK